MSKLACRERLEYNAGIANARTLGVFSEGMLVQGIFSTETSNGIRPMRPASDLAGLAQLIERAFGPELALGGEQVLRELRLLGRLGPLGVLLLATSSSVDGLLNGFVWEQDGQIVGNVTLSRPTGHAHRWQLSNVAVLDEYRGRGIGRSLVETAIDAVLERGGQTAYLYVREDNPAAVHLYESIGFSAVDRLTDLESDAGRAEPAVGNELSLLRRLRPSEGQALYELAIQARGAGQKWLGLPGRRHFVRTADERLFQRLSGLWAGQRETFWGVDSTSQRLRAGLSLLASSNWNHKPHRIEVWVHPGYRGRMEAGLARDIETLVARQAARRVFVSLPGCEQAMQDALVERGFSRVRTLVLMKVEV
jgi:ribosomal protein S18 acetylase RimI-like enzyme